MRPLTLLFALALASCDPGFHVIPVGWTRMPSGHFEKRDGELRVETTAVGGLMGERWAGVDFVFSGATKNIVPKSVVLITPAGRLRGKLRQRPIYVSAASVGSADTVLIGADWHFSQGTTVPKNLGDSPTVEVSFLYGGAPRSFTVTYQRE